MATCTAALQWLVDLRVATIKSAAKPIPDPTPNPDPNSKLSKPYFTLKTYDRFNSSNELSKQPWPISCLISGSAPIAYRAGSAPSHILKMTVTESSFLSRCLQQQQQQQQQQPVDSRAEWTSGRQTWRWVRQQTEERWMKGKDEQCTDAHGQTLLKHRTQTHLQNQFTSPPTMPLTNHATEKLTVNSLTVKYKPEQFQL